MAASPDDILSLVFFARVVEQGSFTKAAAKLGVSKSVASTRISDLEERLGTRLLHRTTRRLSVTADGLALYERAARITKDADEATSLASSVITEPRGVLRVNAPITLSQMYLTQPISAFLERYPSARVELLVSDSFVDLVEERIDVAVRVSAGLRDSSLVARKLADDRPVVCASPVYLGKRGTPATPAELIHHDCIRYALVPAADEWRFRAEGESFSVPVQARFEASNGTVIREAAVAGVGIAVVPSFVVAEDLAAGQLVSILEEFTFVRLSIHAVYASAGVVSPNVRAFVDTLVSHFRVPPWTRYSPEVSKHRVQSAKRRAHPE